ncbi:MAG: hypothetical protein IPG04_17355 [Polyangiaceae bacterium]|nr:hypothetical protein [Polyangiaceae bacterium]
MKNVTINTAAAWAGTFRSYQDGDIFRESNIDLSAGDLADRLGYLKATVDAKPDLDDANVWTEPQTIDGSVWRGSPTCGPAGHRRALRVAERRRQQRRPDREHALGDSSSSHYPTDDTFVVPQLTGNRVYTFNTVPVGNAGRRIRIARRRTADAFTVTIASGTGTLAIISASNAGWVDIEQSSAGGDWRVVAWGGTVTSIDTTTP